MKVCAICGAEFTCGGITGCWCSSVFLSKERRDFLSSVSDDCVCPNCLEGK
ncbi:MAG: cysteine-rich CWC family protein [Candidatus Thermoplasmatota archaeon]|nr:cysteine-rich CWC family protein [Candidatus Thermoplasmatota archaeon]